jgi:hypothetical protein
VTERLSAGAAPIVARPPRDGAQKLPADVLAIALWLSLWLACGSLVLAVADGLGPHPTRRLLIGLVLVVASAAALWQRRTVGAWLRARPWLVVPLAAAQLGVAVIDGLLLGPYVAFSMTSIAVAAVVARPRTVWLCVALLDAGYAVATAIDHTPAALVRDSQLGGVVGALLGYPFAALIGLGLVRSFRASWPTWSRPWRRCGAESRRSLPPWTMRSSAACLPSRACPPFPPHRSAPDRRVSPPRSAGSWRGLRAGARRRSSRTDGESRWPPCGRTSSTPSARPVRAHSPSSPP